MTHGASDATTAAVEFDPFAQPALSRVVPTTEAQREIWLAAKLAPEASLAYNEAATLRLRGALDAAALCTALEQVVARHDALRATFGEDGDRMYIAEQASVPWQELDIAADPAGAEAALAAAFRRAVETPFDLAHGPLFRAALLRTGGDEHVLLLSAHHIVCDGWSWGVIVTELAAAYGDAVAGRTSDPAPAESFADFAVHENAFAASAECEETGRYWISRFASIPPPLDLPADHARPRVRGFASRRCDHVLDAALVKSLGQLARQRGASLYAALLGTFAVLMQRLSGQDDVVVGVPAAGQAAEGHHELVGHAVNILPLRIAVDTRATFAHTLAQVRGGLLDAFEHQRYTFGTLLKHLAIPRDPSRLPLVGVLFNLDRALDPGQLDFGGLAIEFASVPRTFENFEVFVNAVQQPDGGMVLECQYASDLYDEASVRLWLRAYESFLRGICANPDAATGALPWLPADELRSILDAWNDTRVDFGPARCLHALIEEQARRTPDAPAVIDETGTWTFAELNVRANRLAHHLRALGVGPDVLVAVCAERSRELACGLLAVLKAGGAYVPIDPEYPDERIAEMLADCTPRVLLTQERFAGRLAALAQGADVLALDAESPAWSAQSDTDPDPAAVGLTPANLAYVIYTSGSTGKPKGAMNEHRGIVNRLQWMQRAYALDAGDTVLQKTPFTFDVSVWEFFWPMLTGARLLMARPGGHKDPAYLAQTIREQRVTTVHFVPSMLHVFLEQAGALPGHALKRVVCSGEALSRPLVDQFFEHFPGVPLYNLYGPTEAAVDVTAWTCSDMADDASVPIGKPVANTRIAILDASGQPVLPGVRGEIHIGGVQVGRGYLGRPELTAERFVPDPDAPGARMYRTGDLGRWRHDGAIEYSGRNDFQVKLRGLRIELGEIEARLAALPDVAQAVVLMREDRPGDQRLVAYLKARDGAAIDASAVRAQLAKQLPEYMLPQHFVMLDAIPLNSSGKVDRKALPAPQAEGAHARERVAPRDDREAKIAAIMEDVLALPGLGIHDDFFALGGHSLLAAQLTARLNREFDVSLSLRALFDTPTVAGLAETIAAAGHSDEPRIQHLADQRKAPLSKQQERLWIFEQVLSPGTTTYNAPSAHRLHGKLDEAAFQRAFDAVVARQSVLRTSFGREGEEPIQIIHDAAHAALFPVEDLTRVPADEREAVLLDRMQVLADEPFALDKAPLFRARMYRLADDEHVLFFMPHHIIWDGWSFDLFYDDMAAFYRAFCEGSEPVLPPLPYSYGDYAAWHQKWLNGAEAAAHRQERVAWWRKYLERCGTPQPLPTDFPRGAQATAGPAVTEVIRISADLANALRGAARDLDTTVYTLLVGAYALVVAEFGGMRNLAIGTPVRVRPLPELEKLMGHFTNMLPLGLEIDEDAGFDAFAMQVRQRVLEALAAHDIQAQDLVRTRGLRELVGGHPLFGAQFSFQDARARQRDWGGLAQSQIPIFQTASGDDLGAWLLDHGEGMVGGLLYRTDLFRPETGKRLVERYIKLLSAIAGSPRQTIARLRGACVGPDAPAPSVAVAADSVPAAIAAQAARTPDRIAVEWEGGPPWSYAELMQWTDAIANDLLKRGVTHGELVGVCVPRRPEMIAAVLGVMRAGAAYVALDPAFPAERLRYMAEHSGVRHVLTWTAADTPEVLRGFDLVELDGFDPASVQSAPLPNVAGDDLAYVLYTSGSTGKPKGVRILQRNLVNFLESMHEAPGLTENDALCAVTTLCFDIAVLELYLPLLVGARVVMATEREQLEPALFWPLIHEHGVTVLQTTPTLLRLLVNNGNIAHFRNIKLLVGGEALPRDLADAVLPRCRELWNMYGPTETTVWSTIQHMTVATGGAVPLGKPIANTTIHVLDDARNPVAEGETGEIWIGGAGVADGYLHDPGKTAERFLPDPAANDGSRMYRTGDLGHLKKGVLYFDGRADDQIKLRGFRIEPGDIEAAALAESGVKEAVAVARDIAADDKRLLLYVAAQADATLVDRLRKRLRTELPAYMVPQHIERLDVLPHTPNGKIDRKALPLPSSLVASEPVAGAPPLGALEQALIAIWRELLRVQDVDVNDDFFDLGGDSLLAVRVFERTQKLTGVNLPLASLLTAPTIARQATALRAAGAKEPAVASTAATAPAARRNPWAPLVSIQPKGTRPPLFFVHAIGGNVLNYVRLAKGFDADQPIYGLQAVGLDGLEPPLESVPEMAARYVEEIRKVQPHGPYFLAGGSMGGAIAYEIAQQLSADGEPIGMLGLFDTYGPANRRLETAGHRRITLARVWRSLRNRLLRVTDRMRVRHARKHHQALSYDLRHREIQRVHGRAYLAYVPAPSTASITLFRASNQPAGVVDRTLGWSDSAIGGIEVIDIPGHHDDLVEQPELLTRLQEVLRQQQGGSSPG
jgi:amino acid adenylation domain-containing protein